MVYLPLYLCSIKYLRLQPSAEFHASHNASTLALIAVHAKQSTRHGRINKGTGNE